MCKSENYSGILIISMTYLTILHSFNFTDSEQKCHLKLSDIAVTLKGGQNHWQGTEQVKLSE